jgi:hypothetical protein
MQFQVSRISRDECSAGEWEARVDLAAAHRLAVMHGLSEGIFNHLTQVVPGKTNRYYQIPLACTGRRLRPLRSWRWISTMAR